jgi:hypothetical protein
MSQILTVSMGNPAAGGGRGPGGGGPAPGLRAGEHDRAHRGNGRGAGCREAGANVIGLITVTAEGQDAAKRRRT